jgi:hypothetical protein
MTLTASQKKILSALANAPAYNRGGKGPEGMNGNALYNLQQAGLVEMVPNPEHAPMVTFRGRSFHANEWRITAAGRAAISERPANLPAPLARVWDRAGK